MGGKSSPPPPDYGPMREASEYAADKSYALGQDQLRFAERQYEEMKPLVDQVVQSQLDVRDQTMQQAQDSYDYLQNTFRPLERNIVDEAENYNTEAYQQQLARKAAADSARAFQQTQRANERNLASMGVNPNSGRFAASQQSAATSNAAQRAALMNQTRQKADSVGYARQLDAAGLGRNLTGASQGAYGVALNAGNSAVSNAGVPGQQRMQGMAQGIGTIQSGMGMEMDGLGSVLNAQTSVYNTGQQREAQSMAALGQGLGMVGGAAMGNPAFF